MYILDEVDAALDLSHTQNIGHMLKTHFQKSQVCVCVFVRAFVCLCECTPSAPQFIVVSLKHGMFNNANVIFKTKFVDGVSTVARMVGGGAAIEDADGGGAPIPAHAGAAVAPPAGRAAGGGRGRKARPAPAAAAAAAAAAGGGENGGEEEEEEASDAEDAAPRRKAKAARTARSAAGMEE